MVFGPPNDQWFNIFYIVTSSFIQNNGLMSNFFSMERRVRYGDPILTYMFIIAVQHLIAALKDNPNINGIKLNNSLLLDGSELSLN